MAPDPPLFSASFRKSDLAGRRALIAREYPDLAALLDEAECQEAMRGLCDRMVENAVGAMAVPLGIATGFVINGRKYSLPLSTEEPSVIAAASFGAKMVASGGGFEATAPRPLMEGMVYLEGVEREGELALERLPLEQCVELHQEAHPSLYARGGGLKRVTLLRLKESGILRVSLQINVCDAMGANIVNTAAERLTPLLESVSGGRRVMAILSNAMPERVGRVSCRVPLRRLARSGVAGDEIGRRIELACRIAAEDPSRALTHNKGIMNGISALALATANDTRGLEAAVYQHAQGRPLSMFRVVGDHLEGALSLPLPLATVGGAVSVHPVARFSLALLGHPDAAGLARVALSLGLAQNLAALAALTGEGIQEGHMRLHARRLAASDSSDTTKNSE